MYSLAPNVALTEDETGAVLLDQRTGRYWMMNDTGTLVLRRLLRGGTVPEVTAEVRASYPDADPDRVERDAQALLSQLRTAGLVTT
jgi:predicted deacylase